MTPDEVKQLHYKTIIFPIIGYPIIRDTVIYKKFSSYSKGEEKRDIHPLINLSNTYFTVEQLKTKKLDPKERNSSKNIESVELEQCEEMIEYDKQSLLETIEIIKKIFGEPNITFEYIVTELGRAYVSITINKKLLQSDKSKILSKINKNKYHVEIQSNDNSSKVEIHNTIIAIDKSLELKGETNNV